MSYRTTARVGLNHMPRWLIGSDDERHRGGQIPCNAAMGKHGAYTDCPRRTMDPLCRILAAEVSNLVLAAILS